jgi:hypothetical protein
MQGWFNICKQSAVRKCFNPQRARGPAVTAVITRRRGDAEDASKLPERARFQTSGSLLAGCNCRQGGDKPRPYRFQSSARAGCNVDRLRVVIPGQGPYGFNPQPARRPAATRSARSSARLAASFNPQPARRPAATTPLSPAQKALQRFQSSAGPKAGCNPRRATVAQDEAGVLVSILSRPEGRLQLLYRHAHRSR